MEKGITPNHVVGTILMLMVKVQGFSIDSVLTQSNYNAV